MVLAEGIVVQSSEKGGGKTLVATKFVPAGAMVWEEDLQHESHYSSQPRTWEWIQSLPPENREIYCHFMYKTGKVELHRERTYITMGTCVYTYVTEMRVRGHESEQFSSPWDGERGASRSVL